ncbi:MAG: hypothetical protein U1D55_03060 [Phycisphaerae bacterium]
MRKWSLVALIAGATSTALAGNAAPETMLTTTVTGTVSASAVANLDGTPAPGTGIDLRTIVVGYDNYPLTGETVFTSGALPKRAMDDLSLVCGPAEGNPGTFRLTAAELGFYINSTQLTPISFDVVVLFFNDLDTSGTAASPINTNLIGGFRATFNNVVGDGTVHAYTTTPVDLTGLATPIVLPDNGFAVDVLYVPVGGVVPVGGIGCLPAPNCLTPGAVHNLLFGSRPVSIGGSDDVYWRDANANGMYDPADARFFGGPPARANFALRFTGDFVGTSPPPPTRPNGVCLGSLIDDDSRSPAGPLVVNSPMAANSVLWYQITLSQDVVASTAGVPSSDTLDIHTDGSVLTGANPTDTVLSLYDSATGAMIASNDDAPNGPTGTNYSALSFGDDTPRLSVPNGIILGGEDGALNKGIYLIGLSGFPASTLNCAWRHSSTSPETGTVRLNISGNLNNLCAGDLNGDRVVNESDLGILLGGWQAGACGDVNGDGNTSEPDLGIVLANWQNVCP